MQERLSENVGYGQYSGGVRSPGKRTAVMAVFLSLGSMVLMLAGCGGGGSDGISSQGETRAPAPEIVSGVAAAGAPLAGQVTIKDTSNPTREKAAGIASDGSFVLDVTGMKSPFVLEALVNANGRTYSLFSFADGPGTANINPLSNVALAYAAGVSDPQQVYENPDAAMMDRVRAGLPQAVTDLMAKLQPLLSQYAADHQDPVKGAYRADHTGLDGVFDEMLFNLANGVLTITNARTGAAIFTCMVTDVMSGYFMGGANPPPNPGSVPAAPTGVTAAGGAGQTTVSWAAVTGATSYDLYWSTTPGVTTATGTKIPGVTSPYAHTGLAASTAYYYIVTAVNSAGEGPSSVPVSATTAAPTFDALAFYNSNCTGCHGAPSSFSGGRTAAQLQNAIDSNLGGMRRLNTLTPAQVAAIAAILGP